MYIYYQTIIVSLYLLKNRDMIVMLFYTDETFLCSCHLPKWLFQRKGDAK